MPTGVRPERPEGRQAKRRRKATSSCQLPTRPRDVAWTEGFMTVASPLKGELLRASCGSNSIGDRHRRECSRNPTSKGVGQREDRSSTAWSTDEKRGRKGRRGRGRGRGQETRERQPTIVDCQQYKSRGYSLWYRSWIKCEYSRSVAG
jgi:hypothetical protein